MVKPMDPWSINRGRQEDVALRPCERHVVSTSNATALPVFDKHFKSASSDIKDVNRVRTIAGNPQAVLVIKGDAVWHMSRHVDHALKISSGAVPVDCDACDAISPGFHEIDVLFI